MTTSQINPNQLLPFGDDGSNGPDGLGRIIQVPPLRRDEAVARLVWQPGGDRDHARRFLEYAQSHRIPLERLAGISMAPPARLRDLLWAPAHVRALGESGPGEVLLPALAPLTWRHPDGAVRLGRMTVWEEGADGEVPVGQKLLLVDGELVPFLEVREIEIHPPIPAEPLPCD